MRTLIATLVFCFALIAGLGAQKRNAVLANGNFIKNGFEYQGEDYRSLYPENTIKTRSSSGCDDCRPDEFSLPIIDCCKAELCSGWLLPQIYELEALDPDLEILRINIYTLTFCQNSQLDLVVENGLPSPDATVYGREGTSMIGEDFWLEADNFYIVEIIVRNPADGCPTWLRQELIESFYVGTCCEDGVVPRIELFPTEDVQELLELFAITSSDDLEEQDLGLLVYPNPVYDLIMLDMPDELKEKVNQVMIHNSLGQLVMNWSEDAYQFDVSQFPDGIYSITVNMQGLHRTVQFIKQ